MSTEYVLEVWDPKTKRYRPCWIGKDMDQANKMYDKSYYKRHTRRMVVVERAVLFQDKAGESK